MNPFGVESHDISKAEPRTARQQRKHHEKRTYQNILGGVAGLGAATATANRSLDHGAQRESFKSLASRRNYEADSIKTGVESKAKNGRISPTQAAREGNNYRELKQIAGTYRELAGDSAKAASKNKKVAIATGAAGAGLYANGIRHAVKHDKLDKEIRAGKHKIQKSAFGVEHEVSKLGGPKVRMQGVTVEDRDKEGRVYRHDPDTLTTSYKGKSLILRRPKYQAVGHTSKPAKGERRVVAATPNLRADKQSARMVADAYEGKKKTIKIGDRTLKHKIQKSSFGIEH